MESNNDFYIKQLEKHLDRSKNKKDDSVKRFDVLVVSLAVLGLGFVSDYIKGIDDKESSLAHYSQILFVVGIISNLVSQIISIKSNSNAVKAATLELNFEREDQFKELELLNDDLSPDDKEQLKTARDRTNWLHKKDMDKFDKSVQIYNRTIILLNWISFICLIVGLVSFLIFLMPAS